MTLRSIVASIILVSSSAFAQQLAPFGKLLERHYPTLGEDDEALIWVYFRDKGPGAQQYLALARAFRAAYISIECSPDHLTKQEKSF